MSRSPRRLLAAIATTVTLAAGGAVGLAAAAAPASAAAPDICNGTVVLGVCVPLGGGGGGGDPLPIPDPCTVVPDLPTCGGGTTPAACDGTLVLGICVPTGGATDPTTVCETLLTSLGLTADQAAQACGVLNVGGGTPTLPTGASSASPDTFPNNATAQKVVITDPFEQLYSAAGGATVTLNGASTIATTGAAVLDDTAGTITATFDLTKPTPATPGAYTLTVSPADPTGLTAVLGGLGLPALPLDTVPVTVTAATGPGPVTGLTATTDQRNIGGAEVDCAGVDDAGGHRLRSLRVEDGHLADRDRCRHHGDPDRYGSLGVGLRTDRRDEIQRLGLGKERKW